MGTTILKAYLSIQFGHLLEKITVPLFFLRAFVATCEIFSYMFTITQVGTPSTPLYLAQPWLETPELGFQNANARLNWSDSTLHIRVRLDDLHIFSEATAHNQSLHLLGDTAEVFLILPNAPHYYELHVSPHNHRTFLRWPLGSGGGIENVRNGTASLETFRENPNAFASRVQISENGWEIEIDLPAKLLGLESFVAGQEIRFSVSRYDYSSLQKPPILSTTAAHFVKNFHLYEDWTLFQLDALPTD